MNPIENLKDLIIYQSQNNDTVEIETILREREHSKD